MLPTDGRTEAKADKKAALARSLSSFIQTEVSRAEKIKRGKKVSRIHLHLDGIIREGGPVGRAGTASGEGRESYLDTYARSREGKVSEGGHIHEDMSRFRDYFPTIRKFSFFFYCRTTCTASRSNNLSLINDGSSNQSAIVWTVK